MLSQRILPIDLHGLLDDEVYDATVELSCFFRELCTKELKLSLLEIMEMSIIENLCKLEKIFPTIFFDVMVHLAVHLAREAYLCRPMQYRWMSPIKRYLRGLKAMVKK